MKKLILTFGLFALGLSLSAQNLLPYQKGENMISIRNPYFAQIREANSGETIGARYAFELDYHRFITNNWSIGIGGSLDRASYSQPILNVGARTLGMQLSSRYYFPSIPIKSTYLSFFGEASAGVDRYASSVHLTSFSYDRASILGGLGIAWRPVRFMSIDFAFHKGWQRTIAPQSKDLIFESDIMNASAGFNFHFGPRLKQSARQ
ncbi:MAG: hypothetical protein AAF927_10640 [Bacteroidota bacterium]